MKSRSSVPIDSTSIAAARRFIQQQFAQHSWWPAEGPLQAQTEFAAVEQSPSGLTAWCEKWLDASQRRALDRAIRPAVRSSA